MMTSKQRAYLRSLANTLEPIFQIGKSGISENLIQQLSDALDARELIKIHVLETAPDTAKNLGIEISNLTNSTLVQTIGNKITLFKQKEKNSKYELPKE
ncbi:MAG TPA: ribosome assembly RNA-binding protein YhbY [Clostridiaceae bacterium]|nr:ribosome assembly RNA-binding protein YhbY [Clostridiaceae bacterium]